MQHSQSLGRTGASVSRRRVRNVRVSCLCWRVHADVKRLHFPPPCPLSVCMGQGQVESEDQGGAVILNLVLLPSLSLPPSGDLVFLVGRKVGRLHRPLIRDSFSKRDTGVIPASSVLSVPSPCVIVGTELLGSNGLFCILIY